MFSSIKPILLHRVYLALKFSSSSSSRSAVYFALGMLLVYYYLIISINPGDFQGDAHDYFGIAYLIKKNGLTFSLYSTLRGIGYPLFLALCWGENGILVYIVQASLFFGAFVWALRTFVGFNIYCILPIAVAAIPSFAFLQKLLYPDGILMSLSLVFICSYYTERYALCLLVGIILCLIKLIFIAALGAAAVALILSRWHKVKLFRTFFVSASVAGIALFVFTFFMALPDIGYMIAFVRPYAHGYQLNRLLSDSELRFTCSNTEYHLAQSSFFTEPITTPWAAYPYGPLTAEQATRFGCSMDDLKKVKLGMIVDAFKKNPWVHLSLAGEFFLKSLVGYPDIRHSAYIIAYKRATWLERYDNLSYFSPYEADALLPQYAKYGFAIEENGPNLVYHINDTSKCSYENFFRFFIISLLIFVALASIATRRFWTDFLDKGNSIIICYMLVYSFLFTVGGPLIYDRLVYVNMLLSVILVSRMLTRYSLIVVNRIIDSPSFGMSPQKVASC